MTRAVLDTNVLVSALTGGSVTGRIYTMLRQGKFLLVISPDLIEELSHVLGRPVFGLLPADLDAILSFIRAHAVVVDPKESILACRDPEDNKVLECAVEGHVDCIVTRDRDLLVLHPFRGIPILTPRGFLNRPSVTQAWTTH